MTNFVKLGMTFKLREILVRTRSFMQSIIPSYLKEVKIKSSLAVASDAILLRINMNPLKYTSKSLKPAQ